MNKKGFTLVELLMVIVIISIIGALTLPGFIGSINESNDIMEKNLEKLIIEELSMINKDVGDDDFWYKGDTFVSIVGNSYIDNKDSCTGNYKNYCEKIFDDLEITDCSIKNVSITKKDGDYEYNVDVNCK